MVRCQHHAPAALTRPDNPSDHCCFSPRVGMDISEERNLSPLQGFEATFVHPAACSLYIPYGLARDLTWTCAVSLSQGAAQKCLSSARNRTIIPRSPVPWSSQCTAWTSHTVRGFPSHSRFLWWSVFSDQLRSYLNKKVAAPGLENRD